MSARVQNVYKKLGYKLILINLNSIFNKPSFLALSFLVRLFKWIQKKAVLYLAELNQIISAMLDHSSDFGTFIKVLFKTFQSQQSFSPVSQRKIHFLTGCQLVNQLLIPQKRQLQKCLYLPMRNKMLKQLWRQIHLIILVVELFPSQVIINCYILLYFSQRILTLLNAIIRSTIRKYQLLSDILNSKDLSQTELECRLKSLQIIKI